MPSSSRRVDPDSDPHRLDPDRDGVPCTALKNKERYTATPGAGADCDAGAERVE